jgi:hypothetical protein
MFILPDIPWLDDGDDDGDDDDDDDVIVSVSKNRNKSKLVNYHKSLRLRFVFLEIFMTS